MFGRNGKSKKPGTDLVLTAQLSSGDEDDGWAETRPIGEGSGVWLVVRLPSGVEEGAWKLSRHATRGAAVDGNLVVQEATGIEAIKALYDKLYTITKESDADGRYVALDFYGGDRIEALVTGEWRVDIAVAPKALAS